MSKATKNDLRILEIGDSSLHQAAPTWFTNIARRRKVDPKAPAGTKPLRTTRELRQLIADLRSGRYDLVIVESIPYTLWQPRYSAPRNILNIVRRFFREFESLVWTALRYAPDDLPIAVIDRADSFLIPGHMDWLLGKCTRYFKREQLPDTFNCFAGSNPKAGDLINMRRSKRLQSHVSKIRTWPVGLLTMDALGDTSCEKEHDVLYACRPDCLVREQVASKIGRMRDAGINVFAPEQRLPFEEFRRAVQRSWLTLSPEGVGWDCYRHYEASLFGSVPVMNFPTIRRHQPLLQGKHCFFFDVQGDDVVRVLGDALANKDRLRAMSLAGQEHITEHFSTERLFNTILQECGFEQRVPEPSRPEPIIFS